MPLMGTRLERHVRGRAPRQLPGVIERDCFRMGPSIRRSCAAADDSAIPDNYASDGRIRTGATEAGYSQLKRRMHEAAVVVI